MVHEFVDDYGTRWVLKDDHRQVLAENVALYAKQVGQALERLTDDFIFRLAEKDHAYQQLMEKAVGWASYMMTIDDRMWESYKEAELFLDSPEVQAWKEQQKEHKP